MKIREMRHTCLFLLALTACSRAYTVRPLSTEARVWVEIQAMAAETGGVYHCRLVNGDQPICVKARLFYPKNSTLNDSPPNDTVAHDRGEPNAIP